MRDVFWYGAGQREDWVEPIFGPLVCGYCVVSVPGMVQELFEEKLQTLTALDAIEVAEAHEQQRRLLLDCDGGCGRNLIDTCAQLPRYWRPRRTYGRY